MACSRLFHGRGCIKTCKLDILFALCSFKTVILGPLLKPIRSTEEQMWQVVNLQHNNSVFYLPLPAKQRTLWRLPSWHKPTIYSKSWHIYDTGIRPDLWTNAFAQNRSERGRGPSCLGVIQELNESPSNMSRQAADSVDPKVNTMFNLQADHDFQKPFEVNQLT